MNFFDAPILENSQVRLEPLTESHTDDLVEAVSTDNLWRTWYTHIPAPERMLDEIRDRRSLFESNKKVPWAIIEAATGRAVGMTTYLNIEPQNKRLEIGSTWIGRTVQKTTINPAAKLLLLERAFEDLGCIAVEFRTHWHNRQSRAAIEKLGAKQDGVLRNHTIFENGTTRDTVVYSIINAEWPTVKFALEERLRDCRRK